MQPVVFDPAGLRVGQGYDVHAFAEGRKLILGGVDIPHVRGLLGHSDADVLAHAISDALLGGIRGGDIGRTARRCARTWPPPWASRWRTWA